MIAEKTHRNLFPDEFDALNRIGTIPDGIAETINFGDPLVLDVLQHSLKCFEVAVYVADNCSFHGTSPRLGNKIELTIGFPSCSPFPTTVRYPRLRALYQIVR
jgi:hypothetical protein